jgi:hypothetical protein
MLPAERLVTAALKTTHHGLVFIRNATLCQDVDVKYVNAVAEALHEIPAMLLQLERFRGGEGELLELIRIHLGCFDNSRWPDGPNLVQFFEHQLSLPD